MTIIIIENQLNIFLYLFNRVWYGFITNTLYGYKFGAIKKFMYFVDYKITFIIARMGLHKLWLDIELQL